MRKKTLPWLVLALLAAMFLAASPAQVFASTGDISAYFAVNTAAEQAYKAGTDVEFDATHSGFGKLTGGGGLSNADLGRKMTDGQYVEYQFDLDDALSSAVIKLTGTLAQDAAGKIAVEYSVDGGVNYGNLAISGRVYNTGTYFFYINESNALANTDNTFRLKIAASGGSALLYSVFVGNEAAEITADEITLEYISEGYSRHLAASDNGYVWFDNGATPLYFILNGGYVTYYFDLPDSWTNAVWSYNRVANIIVTYSADNETFEPLPVDWNGRIGTKLISNTHNKFYLRFSAEGGDQIIDGIKVAKSTDPVIPEDNAEPGTGVNANAALAKDSASVLFAANTAGEDAYKFFTVDDSFDSTHSGAGKLTGGGGASAADLGRKMGFGECLVYEFDMADSFTSGVIKLFGTLASEPNCIIKVEYSTDGGENYAELSRDGGVYFTGTYFYNIDNTNALQNADRGFRLKISSLGAAILSKVYIGPKLPEEISGALTLNNMEDDYLLHLVGNNLGYVWFDNGLTPLFFTLGGGHVTFYYDLPDAWENARWTVGGAGALTVSYSENGIEFADLPASWDGYLGTKLAENEGNRFYLRFSAAANAINRDIKVEFSDAPVIIENPDAKKPGEGTNLNALVPADSTEIFFLVGTDGEAPYIFYNDEVEFNASHRGMALDNADGGWLASLPKNARRLDADDYLAYDFDLADSLTGAVLKIYGSKELKLSISTDDGAAFTVLTADFLPYQLGYHKYTLSEANALVLGSNKFRLLISAEQTAFFDEIYIGAPDTAPISGSVDLYTHSYDMIKYLESAPDNYTYVGYNKNPYIFFVGADKYAIFKFNLAEGIADINLLVTLIKNGANDVKLQTSTDGTVYTDLLVSSGGGGTPPSNNVSLAGILAGGADTLWIKLIATGQAFARGVTLGIAKADETSGGFTAFSAGEATYAVNINDTLLQNTNEDTVICRTIESGKTAVYRIDLVDTADRVKFDFFVKGAYALELSKDGVNYVEGKISAQSVGLGSLQTFNEYDIFEGNAGNIIYLRFKAVEGNLYLRSLNFTTDGIPNKPITDASDRDDGMVFDYGTGGTPDNFPIPEAPEEPDPVKIGNPYSSEGCGGTGTAAATLITLCALCVGLPKFSGHRRIK